MRYFFTFVMWHLNPPLFFNWGNIQERRLRLLEAEEGRIEELELSLRTRVGEIADLEEKLKDAAQWRIR